jgi:pseudaminic acid biosynthesis-associated methylase
MRTEQTDFWQGAFGQEYTERNNSELEEHDQFYIQEYGTSRTEMNRDFLMDLDIGNILEVGCNVGNQLKSLQSINDWRLYGIELQPYAVERAKSFTRNINIIEGSAFDIPFKDRYFDMVFTSGVLIHISPEHIGTALDEIYRVSNRYVWGFEYFSDEYKELAYRENENKMWKADFKKLFLERFPDLKLVKARKYVYSSNNSNVDEMFLLEKA